MSTASAKKKNKVLEPRTVEDLQVVDCLLPGQVRQLGRRASFVTPRRPIRTTVADCEIRGGEYTSDDPGSYASALAAWLPAAEAGDPAAQTYIGEIFEKGLAGTSSDFASAAQWYAKAAEKGFSRGQINLANLYENGRGVERDQEKALGLYRQAAGITDAMVLDQRGEVAVLQAELEKSAREAAELQELLKESEAGLEAARSALDAARREVEELRKRVEEAKTAQEEAEAARLASQLDARQAQVVARAKAVEELDAKLKRYRARIASIDSKSGSSAAGRAGTAGPSIEIVRPDVLTTRGPALVRVPVGQERMEIAGRVTAPAGLEGLTLDNLALDIDASGFFLAEVPSGERREVVLEAKDRQGKSVQATLILIPGGSVTGGSGGKASDGAAVPGRPEDRILRDRYSRATRGKNHALVISVTEYQHMPKLATAAFDGNEVRRLLESKYGFQVRLLQNPTNVQVFLELDALRREVGPEANLLIYYAGHGKIGKGNRGYWIPVDGEVDDDRNWISNEAVSDMLDVISAKHVLVVSDSCYSGTLTRSGVARLEAGLEGDRRQKSFEAITGKRSRTVLTSGGLQPVLDEGGEGHSLFARAFLNVLERNEDVLLGVDLHREVAARVRFGARALGVDQRPDYAPIRFAGHEAGDFALVPRGAAG